MAEDVTPIQSARIAAALVIGDEILSFGVNHLRSHPFQAKYGKNEHSIFWHAETNAVFNALKRVPETSLQKADLYVVRVKRPFSKSKGFILGMAAPCDGCKKCLADYRIRRIIHSTDQQSMFVCN